MTSYYEVIDLAPTATPDAIRAACDAKYDQWHRLVTHHDQAIRHQAETAIQTIETIRSVLLDPQRRSGYDAGVGLGGAIGGLADPSALLQVSAQATMAPPKPIGAKQVPDVTEKTLATLWACPRCRSENQPNTRFCLNCGTQLVRTCPECKKETSLAATGICGSCGYLYETALRRHGLQQDFRARQSTLHTAIESARLKVKEAQSSLDHAVSRQKNVYGTGCGWVVAISGLGATIGGVLVSLSNGGQAIGFIGFGIALSILGILYLVSVTSNQNRWRAKVGDLSGLVEQYQYDIQHLQNEITVLEARFQSDWAATERAAG